MAGIAGMNEDLVVFFVPGVHQVPAKHHQASQGLHAGGRLRDRPGGVFGRFASGLDRPEFDCAQAAD